MKALLCLGHSLKAALKAFSFEQEPHIAVKIWLSPFGATLKKASSAAAASVLHSSNTSPPLYPPHICLHSPGGKTPRAGLAMARVAKRSDLASSISSGWLYLQCVISVLLDLVD